MLKPAARALILAFRPRRHAHTFGYVLPQGRSSQRRYQNPGVRFLGRVGCSGFAFVCWTPAELAFLGVIARRVRSRRLFRLRRRGSAVRAGRPPNLGKRMAGPSPLFGATDRCIWRRSRASSVSSPKKPLRSRLVSAMVRWQTAARLLKRTVW